MSKKKNLAIILDDPWLEPYSEAINGRHQDAVNKIEELTGGTGNLVEFANAYNYYGLHRTAQGGWVFREWAPNATEVYLVGQFNDWHECAPYRLKRLEGGNWEIVLPARAMRHGDLYKLRVHWPGGEGERIPAYATRVVQDAKTYIFSAQVWAPEQPYEFRVSHFVPNVNPLLIYECHIGMAQNREGVGTYEEFRVNVLPRIARDGYNAIQIMAIQEHPYYGSFGYHVSSFYAASSRFGTPEELKHLIDDAHGMGIAVIMDIVHSHAVKNEVEGLGCFDGTGDLYFYGDDRREHPAWDSLCFDYGKNAVLNFLLSNCKYWMEEYRFDGFRFDGVTSMLYYNHGLGQAFGSYDDYYNGGEDTNAITYLTLANILIHDINPHAITIAEEMSGMPGLARSFKDGGIGFDYRMAMGIPDYWIKTIKERKDEGWKPTSIVWELTNLRADEKPVSVETDGGTVVEDNGLYRRVKTTFTFTNPNSRQMSADFEFPIPAEATVCGYALEINGAMVPGVVCGKEKARVAFESEKAKRVDPGIVEHVKGNVWKTRIFPLNPRTPRKAEVEYVVPVDETSAKTVYERDGEDVFVGERAAQASTPASMWGLL